MRSSTVCRAWAAEAPSVPRHHRMPAPRTTSWEHRCSRHRGRRSGRRSSRIRDSRNAQHSLREALSMSTLHPPPLAPAAPTSPLTTQNRRHPRRRRARPEAAPPLDTCAGGGGCSAAHIHRWPGLPAAPSTLACTRHLSLRVGALAPRRCRSRLQRLRLHLRSRRMTVAGDPQTPPFSEGENISTLEVTPAVVFPPSTTRAPLTAQHA
jgi:hypothetical protein